MAIKLTLANNRVLSITPATPLLAWKGTHDKNEATGKREYFAESIFAGTLVAEDAADLDLLVALQGFIHHADWFALGDRETEVFQTNAVIAMKVTK